MASTSSEPASAAPANRYALTATAKQRSQLDRLLKDPAKPAFVPAPPKEKTIRPAREMMKNVQGSSAGAGSGEFHVYKASRRREYERLKMLEDEVEKETVTAEFERKRREAEEAAEAKTSKNRAKRQKKKDRSKMKGAKDDTTAVDGNSGQSNPVKKRRLVNGKELVFKRPGEESDEEEEETENPRSVVPEEPVVETPAPPPTAVSTRITIHDD